MSPLAMWQHVLPWLHSFCIHINTRFAGVRAGWLPGGCLLSQRRLARGDAAPAGWQQQLTKRDAALSSKRHAAAH